MTGNRKILIAKIAAVLAVLPIVTRAYEFGPDPFRTGAPGDDRFSGGSGDCLDSGCHSGAALNKGGGSVTIVLPGGNSYTPGVKQHIMVKIVDAAKQKFGFELTARLASGTATNPLQAGDLASSDGLTQIICSDGGTKGASGCSPKFPIQFIEHSIGGYTASTAGSYTYQFDWTPPATNVGNVNLYVAANAGPGGAAVSTGADVYTTSLTLTPAAAATTPAITPGGVVPVYSSSTTVQPGSWFSVYGSNLASATTLWNGDFPTSLGNTTVTVNNKPAYLWFVSGGQINAQAPDDTATGTVPVVVTTPSGTANTTITLAQAGPSFLLLADAKHVTGLVFSPTGTGGSQGGGTYDLLGPASAGAGFRPAKKGEVVALYAVGFGPTDTAAPAGKIYTCPSTGCAKLLTMPQVTIGGVPVTVSSATIAGAGLYQLIFTIPANAASGDLALSAIANGAQSQANVVIPVQ